MKVVYVLVSREEDVYFEQFLISVHSLKFRETDCNIIVLTDDLTEKSFRGGRKIIYEIVDDIISIDFPENITPKQRSRWLKTSMRNIVDGDFLFIDCDTVICDSLSEITTYKADLYAVMDGHAEIGENFFSKDIVFRANVMGFHAGVQRIHYNSGIMWIRDTAKNRDFFELWHKLWRETCEHGYEMDQLSFNEANWRYGGYIHELDGVWNCQIELGIKYLAASKIIHYNCFNIGASKNREFAFVYQLADTRILEQLKQNEDIIGSHIRYIIENPKIPEAFPNAKMVRMNCDDYKIIQGVLFNMLRTFFRITPKVYENIELVINRMRRLYKNIKIGKIWKN